MNGTNKSKNLLYMKLSVSESAVGNNKLSVVTTHSQKMYVAFITIAHYKVELFDCYEPAGRNSHTCTSPGSFPKACLWTTV